MSPEELLAALLKALAALTVLRWPLGGALLCITADLLDIVIMNYVDLGGAGIRNYHAFDKWSDLFALAAFLAVATRWSGRDRVVALTLGFIRLAGVVLYEATAWRGALIVAPNLFEVWFLYVVIRDRWIPPEAQRLRVALLVGLTTYKLAQEYVLHSLQILDRYNLADLVERWGPGR